MNIKKMENGHRKRDTGKFGSVNRGREEWRDDTWTERWREGLKQIEVQEG